MSYQQSLQTCQKERGEEKGEAATELLAAAGTVSRSRRAQQSLWPAHAARGTDRVAVNSQDREGIPGTSARHSRKDGATWLCQEHSHPLRFPRTTKPQSSGEKRWRGWRVSLTLLQQAPPCGSAFSPEPRRLDVGWGEAQAALCPYNLNSRPTYHTPPRRPTPLPSPRPAPDSAWPGPCSTLQPGHFPKGENASAALCDPQDGAQKPHGGPVGTAPA